MKKLINRIWNSQGAFLMLAFVKAVLFAALFLAFCWLVAGWL